MSDEYAILCRPSYVQKIVRVCGASLVDAWPLRERAGGIAYATVDPARNGVHTTVALGSPGIGDGEAAPTYTASVTDVYTSNMAAAFNGAAGTVLLWMRMLSWTDATARYVFRIAVDGSNDVSIWKSSTSNRLLYDYRAAGTLDQVQINGVTELGWAHIGITWDKAAEQLKAYFAGVQVGTTATSLGTWAGAPTSTRCNFGAQTAAKASPFTGDLAYGVLCNAALSPLQIAELARV